ncbi:MAG: precorrin-2 C(20)-methyltransferase [Desulfovibrio sp.]|jgi:precorrin-2/cobalt-factor-2 C20-methyltransferase|nr:precorrin-2 C(20)-methyltransferase [Desulfovibrio sp.]
MSIPVRPGVLYGVGIGPGEADLLTLRAVAVLRKADVVVGAASPRNERSLALDIAAPYLSPEVRTLRLNFPMTSDAAARATAWEDNAREAAVILQSGRDIAFLTLGDPLVYSTFGYLMQTMERLFPELPVEVVPGITSFQAAAARTRTVLCQDRENLVILSGINGAERLGRVLDAVDSAVILKVYKNIEAIRQALAERDACRRVMLVSRLGLAGESLSRGLDAAGTFPPYLSLLLLPPRREGQEIPIPDQTYTRV